MRVKRRRKQQIPKDFSAVHRHFILLVLARKQKRIEIDKRYEIVKKANLGSAYM